MHPPQQLRRRATLVLVSTVTASSLLYVAHGRNSGNRMARVQKEVRGTTTRHLGPKGATASPSDPPPHLQGGSWSCASRRRQRVDQVLASARNASTVTTDRRGHHRETPRGHSYFPTCCSPQQVSADRFVPEQMRTYEPAHKYHRYPLSLLPTMGLDDTRYCKVTVRKADSKTSRFRVRRQTVDEQQGLSCSLRRCTSDQPPGAVPRLPSYAAYASAVHADLKETQDDDDDDVVDIAVLSEDDSLMSSRRRAHTTSSLSSSARLSNVLNPLSRLTTRFREHSIDAEFRQTGALSTSSTSSTVDLMDPRLLMATPPPMMDVISSFLELDTDGNDDAVRPTLEDAASLMAKTPPIPTGMTLEMLSPAELKMSPISLHLSDVLLDSECRQRRPLSRAVGNYDDREASESEMEDDNASSASTDDYGDDVTDHSVDISSILCTREQAVANSGASPSNAKRFRPQFRTPTGRKRMGGSARSIRGLSSPPRMVANQVGRPRKATVPDAGEGATGFGAVHFHDNEVPSVPLHHGQELHLAFRTTKGQLTQVQGHSVRRKGHKNPFSRRVRCNAVQPHDALADSDTLRIIGHTTTNDLLCGGDCVSFARTNGTVLRMQKMSKKLTFSNKIDERAKFVIVGVPDRTPVTSTSKFYLRSVYDNKKTVGYLASRREDHPGCLAMYVHRDAEDNKVEPIQFFKRDPGHGLAFGLRPQQWL
ncbi:unnamed protein product [Hyaloperonospora brassicae]|uniref:Tubby C-terminal domain-containing protein n=1 Tax=Hyaloperonospora brassicae TaxID=162125 RepID=A0AAV0U829_HYABA|nr:unnamed protein product [Hyaloperonospora brassicae]